MPRSNDGRWVRNCEVCGDPFQQRRPGVRTCGVVCRAQLPHNTGGTQAKHGLESRQCQSPECGKLFQPVRENQVACSRKCLLKVPSYQKSQRKSDNRPERRAAQNRRRNIATAPDVGMRRFINLRNNLRQKHGIVLTFDQYQAWRSRQDGRCRICSREVSGKSAHADHDHETKQLRDELCDTCNIGVGCFKDDPGLLRAAAEYIERHRLAAVT